MFWFLHFRLGGQAGRQGGIINKSAIFSVFTLDKPIDYGLLPMRSHDSKIITWKDILLDRNGFEIKEVHSSLFYGRIAPPLVSGCMFLDKQLVLSSENTVYKITWNVNQ